MKALVKCGNSKHKLTHQVHHHQHAYKKLWTRDKATVWWGRDDGQQARVSLAKLGISVDGLQTFIFLKIFVSLQIRQTFSN